MIHWATIAVQVWTLLAQGIIQTRHSHYHCRLLLTWDFPYSMEASMRLAYWGFFAAAKIKEGLVVACGSDICLSTEQLAGNNQGEIHLGACIWRCSRNHLHSLYQYDVLISRSKYIIPESQTTVCEWGFTVSINSK